MNTRGLPGTFAPMYQEFAVLTSVMPAISATCATHASCASGVGSMLRSPRSAQVLDGVGDPVDVLLDGDHHVAEHRRAARAGDEEQVREPARPMPRYVRGPSAQRSGSTAPSRPRTSIALSAPVI